MRLFSIPAVTPLFRDPLLGRPILGASNHGYLLSLLITWIFGCWCEETQEDSLKVFILSKNSACKTINIWGK